MTWLAPIAGIILAASTLPLLLALYFLRLRRSRRTMSSTLLWTRSVEDLRANTLFQRMRWSWLLALQVLVLGLLALALAQPQADLGIPESGRVVLLIDQSASMNATDADGLTRLERAKREAHQRIDALFGGGWFARSPEVMVVAFAREAQVLSPFSSIAARAHDAVDAVAATDEVTTLSDALELARSFMEVPDPDRTNAPQESGVTLELWSDGRIPDLSSCVVRAGETLRYHALGSADSVNAGVAGAGVARLAGRPDEVAVFARVLNWDERPLHTDVELRVDGSLRAVLPDGIDVPAAGVADGQRVWVPGEVRVSFPSVTVRPNGIVDIRLTKDDALPTDNRISLVAAPAHQARVLLVGGSPILQSVLAALPLASLDRVTAEQFAARSGETGWLDAFDAIVIDGVLPSALPPAHYVLMGGVAPFEGLNPYGEKSDVYARSVQSAHPLLRFVNLDELGVARATAYSPSSDVETVADGSDGPLIMTVARAGSQAVIVSFDPLDSNWPFQRGFVNFVANAVEYLAASGRDAALPTIAPGDTQLVRMPSGVSDAKLVAPSGERESVLVADPMQCVIGPLRRAGVWELSFTSGGEAHVRPIAVALQDAQEGRLGTVRDLALASETIRGERGEMSSSTGLWPWLLLTAVAVLALEWLVYLRKV